MTRAQLAAQIVNKGDDWTTDKLSDEQFLAEVRKILAEGTHVNQECTGKCACVIGSRHFWFEAFCEERERRLTKLAGPKFK